MLIQKNAPKMSSVKWRSFGPERDELSITTAYNKEMLLLIEGQFNGGLVKTLLKLGNGWVIIS